MGYDQPRSLGRGETGSQSALPIWINFMGSALKGLPQKGWAMPAGIITENIDPATGTRLDDSAWGDTASDGASVMSEHFYQEFPPPDAPTSAWDTEPDAFATPDDTVDPVPPTKPAPVTQAKPAPDTPIKPVPAAPTKQVPTIPEKGAPIMPVKPATPAKPGASAPPSRAPVVTGKPS
jgi:hypothetical protein